MNERKKELERFAEAVREAQLGVNSIGLYFPSGKLGKKELLGFEGVWSQMRQTLTDVERSLLPRRKR